jgi:3-oxoacyl-[acyl-carrier-protein] synthase-3
MLDYIRRRAKIENNKFIMHIADLGNTVSNTIPIALKEKCIGSNYQNIVIAGFGVGYSLAGCVLSEKL